MVIIWTTVEIWKENVFELFLSSNASAISGVLFYIKTATLSIIINIFWFSIKIYTVKTK